MLSQWMNKILASSDVVNSYERWERNIRLEVNLEADRETTSMFI